MFQHSKSGFQRLFRALILIAILTETFFTLWHGWGITYHRKLWVWLLPEYQLNHVSKRDQRKTLLKSSLEMSLLFPTKRVKRKRTAIHCILLYHISIWDKYGSNAVHVANNRLVYDDKNPLINYSVCHQCAWAMKMIFQSESICELSCLSNHTYLKLWIIMNLTQCIWYWTIS